MVKYLLVSMNDKPFFIQGIKRMILQRTLVALLLLPTYCFALDDKTSQANVAKELAVCAAYFFIGSEVAKKNGDAELEKNIKTTADAALVTSINLSSKEIATKTLSLAMKDHQRMINNNSANIGVLIRKYKTLCKNLIASPKKRYEFWQKK